MTRTNIYKNWAPKTLEIKAYKSLGKVTSFIVWVINWVTERERVPLL